MYSGFQYILCYGSTGIVLFPPFVFLSFQYILCYGSTLLFRNFLPVDLISIHLMLRFNYGWYSNIWIRRKFQYILCYGSTFIFFHKKIPPKIFQYILCYGSTTHSGFRLLQQNQFQYILCYGSTKTISILCKNKIRISIHLMLRFNGGRRK